MTIPGKFLHTLRMRNAALYYFGWLCWAGAMISFILLWTTSTQVAGISAAIKPFKFFLSIAVAVWTLGWLTAHLTRRRAMRQYTWATIGAMGIELIIICVQAARGRMSHFNVATPADALLFQIMGIAITVFTVWTAVIAGHFFRHYDRHLPKAYLWGIRLGLMAFVLFAFEGGIMGALLRHTVGSADSPNGLPFLNWSTQHGDLRTAHFFGLHSLQVLPIAGWLLQNRFTALLWFAGIYLGIICLILVIALKDLPLL